MIEKKREFFAKGRAKWKEWKDRPVIFFISLIQFQLTVSLSRRLILNFQERPERQRRKAFRK